MNIHKFNAKPNAIPHKTIQWHPLRKVKYPAQKVNPMTWKIFSQQEIKLDPKEVKTNTIRARVHDERGSCFNRVS